MNILAVDDEALQLEKLVDALETVVPDAHIVNSRRPSEALYLAEETPFDVAFLDVQMRGMSGIELAALLKRVLPRINIVFVTAFNDFKGSAMDMRASGYITKPVSAQKIHTELVNLRYPVPALRIKQEMTESESVETSPYIIMPKQGEGMESVLPTDGYGTLSDEAANLSAGQAVDVSKRQMLNDISVGANMASVAGANAADLVNVTAADMMPVAVEEEKPLLYIQCFGNFDVFDSDHKPLSFSRSKAKELLAYLVFRRGSRCTSREIASVLFESAEYTPKVQDSFRHITSALVKALRSIGAEEAILRDRQNYAIDVTMIDCDYYRFMQEDPLARNIYTGEFMTQYSWAEYVNAYLDSQI